MLVDIVYLFRKSVIHKRLLATEESQVGPRTTKTEQHFAKLFIHKKKFIWYKALTRHQTGFEPSIDIVQLLTFWEQLRLAIRTSVLTKATIQINSRTFLTEIFVKFSESKTITADTKRNNNKQLTNQVEGIASQWSCGDVRVYSRFYQDCWWK